MEFETYEDVIDAYNSGVGVEPGDTLTDYIKKNNIKIKEIEMSPLGDLKKISKKANGGIMRTMYAKGDDPRDFEDETEETDIDVMELMRDQGVPMGEQVKMKNQGIMQLASETPEEEREMLFLMELEEFLDQNPGSSVDDFIDIKVKELVVNKQAREDELARITLAAGGGELVGNQKKIDVAPPFGEITGADFAKLREDKQSGGIAGILGV